MATTKVKGDKIKEGSIPLSALSSDMNIPAYTDFVKELSNEDINTTLEIPYANEVVLVTPYDTRILNTGESTVYNNYGMTFTFTASQIASRIDLHIEGQGSLNIFGIRVYKGIKKIKKEFLPDDIGTSNWNAQEGEEGYIENKPFRIIKSKDGQITNINSYFTIREDEYYPTSDLYIKYNNKTTLLTREKDILFWDDGAIVDVDNCYFYLTDDGDSNILITTDYSDEFELLVTLSSEFIPNTVLKTTPQTLTDDNKNQALANLGIDPVVWKYMCEPYVVQHQVVLPEELKNIIQDENGYLKNIASKLLVMEYDSKIYTITSITGNSITSELGTLEYSNGRFEQEP